MFTKRQRSDIFGSMAARFLAATGVTDVVEEGSVPGSIIGTMADEVDGIEFRQQTMQRAWNFTDLGGAKGQDLDDRMAQLPGGALPRLGASSAVTLAIQVAIADTSIETVIAAGTVYGRSDDAAVRYVQTNEVTVPIGVDLYPGAGQTPIEAVATIPGTRGNAEAAGAIDTLVSGDPNILLVTSTAPISGGAPAEEDDPYRQRGQLYLGALAGSQAMALEFLARSFVAADGTASIRFAKAIEDPRRPGYTELVVDDGAGMQFAGKGAATSGVVPEGDAALIQTVIYHQAPGKDPIAFNQFTRQAGGVGAYLPVPLYDNGRPRWVSIPERGLLYPDPGVLSPGDGWSIDPYLVYGGPIAELQTLIEGVMATLFTTPGKRSSGTRVRVVPPTLQTLLPGPNGPAVEVQVTVLGEVDSAGAAALRDAVKAEVVAFVSQLDPGAPLFLAALSAKLMALDGIRNVKFNAPLDDVYPHTPRHKLFVAAVNVEVV